jgi:putative ABC transport system ATP-binding protein
MVSVSSDPSAKSPIVVARGLSKTYGTGRAAVHALRDVDLDLPRGELVVLLGASGSGKSTLLNLLGGLDKPTTGSLHYRNWDVGRADEKGVTAYRRDVVGFVFQFYNLIASLTARENIGLITEVSRNPMSPDEALDLVGLTPRAHHFPAQLSGGEQQRVAIARAIAKRPEILLCDEPTGALDIKTGVLVLEAVQRINRELGTLTIVITHNAVLAEMANRVFTLSDGQLSPSRVNLHPRPVGELSW